MAQIFSSAELYMTKFGLGMHHHDVKQSVMNKGWFAIIKVKVTVRTHNQNMTVSAISSELLIIFGSKLSLVVHHHKPKSLAKRLDCGDP